MSITEKFTVTHTNFSEDKQKEFLDKFLIGLFCEKKQSSYLGLSSGMTYVINPDIELLFKKKSTNLLKFMRTFNEWHTIFDVECKILNRTTNKIDCEKYILGLIDDIDTEFYKTSYIAFECKESSEEYWFVFIGKLTA